MKQRIVIALGGNAIEKKGERGTYDEQMKHVAETARGLCGILSDKNYEVVLTHGNGPQVGNILIQNAAARGLVPPMPMFICDAMSQGEIGYVLERSFVDECAKSGVPLNLAAVITSVEVDKNDAAFQNPSKPVGQFYEKSEAEKISKETGYIFKEDAGRGWRRVVPSPEPLRILEIDAIRNLMSKGVIPIACGGGGIPVVRSENGGFAGVEAVIDKDKAAALLADLIGADTLVILTAVKNVFLNFGKSDERPIEVMSIKEASMYLEEGQFAEGSMRPKIEAVMKFVAKSTSRRAIIANPADLLKALAGMAGTCIRYN